MKFTPQSIPEVILITPKVFGDARGFFTETYNEAVFREAGLQLDFCQDNHSRSTKNVLRGLHFQKHNPQGKLVRVVNGTVFDVAVDIRPQSSTYRRWVGVTLSAENHQMLWVPPGFAHGFLVLSDTVDFLYKVTALYDANDQHCIRWNDPAIGIQWPILTTPVLSKQDAEAKGL